MILQQYTTMSHYISTGSTLIVKTQGSYISGHSGKKSEQNMVGDLKEMCGILLLHTVASEYHGPLQYHSDYLVQQ